MKINPASRRFKALVLVAVLLSLFLFSARQAAAQANEGQPAIQQMRIQILPEYDDPRVLVIAQGRLDVPGGEYNGPVTFRIPTGAQINQMAVMDLDLGSPQFQPYETQVDPTDPAWQLVTYTLNNPHFFYEYYYDQPGSGSQKQFTFLLKNPTAISVLSIEVQQPLRAENLSLEPAAATNREDPSGFTFWQFADRAVNGDEEVAVVVRYTKSDPNPSVARETAVSETPAEVGSAVSEVGAETPSWIGLTVIGAALIIGVGLIRFRIRANNVAPLKTAVPPAEREYMPRTAVQSQTPQETSASPTRPKFCTQCGQGISTRDRFCPYCGVGVKQD